MTDFLDLHRTLQRQLRRSGIESLDGPPTEEQWEAFLVRVSTAYDDAAQAQQLNERALSLASDEMQELYLNLEQRVADRTRDIEQAQSELQATNEELQAQSEELESQHEQLQNTNVELEVKSQDLEAQRAVLEERNAALNEAKRTLEIRAEELARASQYKSAFLASMSHELRTPLNSLLILSDILAQNADGNLTGEQVEFASTIHGAGSDLLKLINEILDLAKIESGGVTLDITPVTITSVVEAMQSMFRPVVTSQALQFTIDVADSVPAEITSDATKLHQILKNLLSNACKFTSRGSVSLLIGRTTADQLGPHFSDLESDTPFVSFSVVDTGVGIPEDKKNVIFEAFQQADQGTARRYGGTGLGLSISRELAKTLGGDIMLASEPGMGSTFTLVLPEAFSGTTALKVELPDPVHHELPETTPAQPQPGAAVVSTAPEHATGARRLLIVEDDLRFASILEKLATSRGFEPIVATTGTDAIRLAEENPPDAVTLDLRLPDMDGWVVLDRFRHNPHLTHVPVHIISVEEEQERGRRMGAFGYLTKPVSRRELDDALKSVAAYVNRAVSRLLVVDSDPAERAVIVDLLKAEDVEIETAASNSDALEVIEAGGLGCVVTDLSIDDNSGFELIVKVRESDPNVPIIGLTDRELSPEERQLLHKHAVTVIARGDRSLERLLDETSLFLHRVTTSLPPAQQEMLRSAYAHDPGLEGRTILIVDDDPRNVFAIGNVLERHGMSVLNADNGRSGIETLRSNSQVDVVLMDIMMPEMDGYEAMRQIRSDQAFATLPILALTALAMGGDRAKCLEAGASDYISKPIEPAQLLSLLRVWLHR